MSSRCLRVQHLNELPLPRLRVVLLLLILSGGLVVVDHVLGLRVLVVGFCDCLRFAWTDACLFLLGELCVRGLLLSIREHSCALTVFLAAALREGALLEMTGAVILLMSLAVTARLLLLVEFVDSRNTI